MTRLRPSSATNIDLISVQDAAAVSQICDSASSLSAYRLTCLICEHSDNYAVDSACPGDEL